MKPKSLPIAIGIALLALILILGWGPTSAAAQQGPSSLYLPFIGRVTSMAAPATAIIANHLHTDVSQIPAYWIDQARKLTIHYAHTSHGSQVLSGLEWLAARDARFKVAISTSDTVELPADTTALRIYDGNGYGGNNYITPDMYWEGQDGVDHTRSVADTGLFDISLWTWCGQMSSYSQEQVGVYIDTLLSLRSEYPQVRYIYYTGHTDGSTPDSGSTLWQNNEFLRDYVEPSQHVLFDFADIESYDPDGNFYPDASDSCQWCDDWCSAHPANFECQDVPAADSGCAHTHGLQCTLKAQAFWWMLARLAGWDGKPAQ